MKTSRGPVPVSLLLLFLFVYLQISALVPAFSPSLNAANSSYHLQDVLKEISARQRWELNDVRVSKLDMRKVRFGSVHRFEFRVGFGRTQFLIKSSEEVDSWKKFRNEKSDFGSLVSEVASMAVLDMFRVEGPFELRVGGGDELSLFLPMNVSHNRLNRILVGVGITVEVRRAQEVSVSVIWSWFVDE